MSIVTCIALFKDNYLFLRDEKYMANADKNTNTIGSNVIKNLPFMK